MIEVVMHDSITLRVIADVYDQRSPRRISILLHNNYLVSIPKYAFTMLMS